MANLRGGTFEKQIKDAFHRTLKYRQKRHLQQDHGTHSVALAKKREMYLRDFKDFLQQKGITQGKLNTYMTKENVTQFLEQRVANLAPKTQLDYITGFSSLLEGLREQNVTIPIQNPSQALKTLRIEARAIFKRQEIQKGRVVRDISQKLDDLYAKRFESGVIAQIQKDLGLRVSEAFELAKNFDRYYNKAESVIEGLKGKGNHIYNPKPISQDLVKKIEQIKELPSYTTYLKDLKEIGIEKTHNLLYTYAKEQYITKLEQGVEHRQALKEVSQEINHHREEMTNYYLNRA